MRELNITPEKLAAMIDHTLLKPDATADDIRILCREAREHAFCSVCVNPTYVSLAAKLLNDSRVRVCTVVGFPLGAGTSSIKVAETKQALSDGADEIDMVVAIGAVKAGDWESVERDVASVRRAIVEQKPECVLKVIFETCLLSDDEIRKLARLCVDCGVDFVKTSTGFSKAGANKAHVRLMRETVGEEAGVKASGGIRTLEDALSMIESGANRIGASAGVQIVEELADTLPVL